MPISNPKNVKLGMVMDFGDLKKIVNTTIVDKFDHSLIINENSPHKHLAETLIENGHKIVFTNYQPTIEEMVVDFSKKISKNLPKDITLHSLKLEETESSYSEWFAEDNLSFLYLCFICLWKFLKIKKYILPQTIIWGHQIRRIV